MELKKGMTVTAMIYSDVKPAHVAGVMLKYSAHGRTISGVVRHIRGDHPTQPTSIGIAIEVDGSVEWVNLNNVVGIE